jgi:GNAT superfamily N-acetyltransferase/ssDNA-binding Zn-finger/Zn-ribbon topoisomerase 1
VKIVTYRELKEKSSLLPLMEQAFGWPFEELEYEKVIKTDPRLKNGVVGFCGVDGERVLGFVGVDDFATRTADGELEKAGGVFAVATLPGYTRQGVCTKLLNRAHEYFWERGYRFSFLTAGQPSVAHALYCKLGYSDVTSFLSAYKLKEKTERKEASKPKKSRKWDFDRILDFYAEYVKGRTGFVVRDRAYIEALAKQYEITARECITTQKGYVIFKKEKKHARVRELIARDKREMNHLIELVERQAQNVVIGRVPVGDPVLSQVYRSRGFTVLEKGHGVLMVKELSPQASFTESYGNRFYMSALDHF